MSSPDQTSGSAGTGRLPSPSPCPSGTCTLTFSLTGRHRGGCPLSGGWSQAHVSPPTARALMSSVSPDWKNCAADRCTVCLLPPVRRTPLADWPRPAPSGRLLGPRTEATGLSLFSSQRRWDREFCLPAPTRPPPVAAFLREGTKCLLKKYPVYSWRRTEPSTGADSVPALGLPADGAASGVPRAGEGRGAGAG